MLGIHNLYWVVPLLCACAWLTNLVGLLGFWRADDLRQYQRDEATIVFVSDVGAAHHPFFIGLCCTTAGLYILTVLIERQLRHARRIPGSTRRRTTIYDIFSVIFAIIGGLGLIFLSIFDAFQHPTAHWLCTLVFILGTAISVLFQVLEVFELAKGHPSRRGVLLATAIIKSVIFIFAILVAITFAALYGTCRGNAPPSDARCNRITSAAAVCEWTVSFVLFFYFLTYIADFTQPRQEADVDTPYVEGRPFGRAGAAPDMSEAERAHGHYPSGSQTTLNEPVTTAQQQNAYKQQQKPAEGYAY